MTNEAASSPPKDKEIEKAGGVFPALISDHPAADQTILHENHTYTTIKEGLAYILIPPDTPLLTDPSLAKDAGPSQSVFYNPIQQYNRDLTVLAIRAFGETFVAEKKSKIEKGREKRQKKSFKKKERKPEVQEQRVEGSWQPAAKRRKLNSGPPEFSTPVEVQEDTGEKKDIQSALQATDLLEDDELRDEDLLACEKALGNCVPLQHSTGGQSTQNEAIINGNEDEKMEHKPSFRVLDALSATGLRALRYAQELPFITSVTANDLSPKAVEMINLNIKHNKLEDKIETSTGNANAHMYSLVGQEGRGGPGSKYEVIDIDPYGTAVPFLDAAIQALSNGGLLCVTCTDSGVFNSIGYSEKTYALYGGLPLKGEHCHEAGLRLILHAIANSAAKYGISVEPLLSLSIDYYARVFVRVRRSPAEVKFLSSKTMLVYGCDHGCGSWQTQFLARASPQTAKNGTITYKHGAAQGPTANPLCEHCGSKTHIAGPMYGGPLHNPSFIDKMLSILPFLDKDTYKTLGRIEGMLETAYDEMQLFGKDELLTKTKENDKVKDGFEHISEVAIDRHPFFVIPSALARTVHCQAPSDAQLRGAFRSMGYKAVRSHAKPGTIKTDAPWTAIWDIMREWVRQKAPIKEGSLREGMAGFRIMQKQKNIENVNSSKNMNGQIDTPKDAKETRETGGKLGGTTTPEALTVDDKNAQAQGVMTRVMFDEKLGTDKQTKRLVRYQMNPRANWGPMSRAK